MESHKVNAITEIVKRVLIQRFASLLRVTNSERSDLLIIGALKRTAQSKSGTAMNSKCLFSVQW